MAALPVLLADDPPGVREGGHQRREPAPDIEVEGEAGGCPFC
jgi:hypothetical protein